MPDYNQTSVILAYREGLIDKEEAREALGFHTPTGDDAVSFADDILRLEVELAQAREALKSEKTHALAEYTRGYNDGWRAGAFPPVAPPSEVKPTWIGYPPATTGGIYPTSPGRTFTVNGAGEAVETLNSTTP